MIVLFTDFGREGPYTGQMTAVLRRLAPEVEIIDLIADAPAHDPQLAAYFLAAYVDEFPPQTVFLCVVDPGVGGDRSPGVLQADGRWFVGPDNGLFEPIIRRCRDDARWRDILWRPSTLSATFHGRDLFAPVAARLARGLPVPWRARSIVDVQRPQWPDDLLRVVYIDGFGNAMTGIRASKLAQDAIVRVGAHVVRRAKGFSEVSPQVAFWYENANGLVELAVNRGRADQILCVQVGSEISAGLCDLHHRTHAPTVK